MKLYRLGHLVGFAKFATFFRRKEVWKSNDISETTHTFQVFHTGRIAVRGALPSHGTSFIRSCAMNQCHTKQSS
jgi:hypothetical protein